MPSEEETNRWKADAQQLKQDLDSRKKIVQKREIPIQFGNTTHIQKAKTPTPPSPPPDHFLRQQLGI